MNNENNVYQVLQKYLPEQALACCYQLWQQYRFKLIITRKRESKLGDYRFIPSRKAHIITLNNDLNKYAFLITYIHEVAHLQATVKFGFKIKPHGAEWKTAFKNLLAPLLQEEIIPNVLLVPLKNYISDPKASSCSDVPLQKALRGFDPVTAEVYLSEINIGDAFQFNRRRFVKEEKKRSRALCKEMPSGRKYLIPESALIQPLGQTSLNFTNI